MKTRLNRKRPTEAEWPKDKRCIACICSIQGRDARPSFLAGMLYYAHTGAEDLARTLCHQCLVRTLSADTSAAGAIRELLDTWVRQK